MRETAGTTRTAGSPPVNVWAEETAEVTIRIKLRQGSSDVTLEVPPNATFATVISKYCATRGGGLTPAQVSLFFDGDALPPSATLAEREVEEDDLIDVTTK